MPDKNTVIKIAIVAGIILFVWVLIRINRMVFRKMFEKKEGLHLRLFEKLNASILLIGGVILAFSVFDGISSVWKTLLGGTAILSAVLVFAAQDVIKDILAGLMISVYKPFEIGNRVELEDGTVGIIEDITMRHVVIRGLDTQIAVIPNSKLNAMSLRNFSYHAGSRSVQFDFHIAYGSDVERAMEVIRGCVVASPFTVPGKRTAGGTEEYAPIYFMAHEDSSLLLSTTVYFDSSVAPEEVKSDVNLRVDRALAEAGIEIPFQYINVIQKQ